MLLLHLQAKIGWKKTIHLNSFRRHQLREMRSSRKNDSVKDYQDKWSLGASAVV